MKRLADGIGIIFQLADLPEAVAVRGIIPFLGGIFDYDLPSRERQAGAAIYLVAGQAAGIIIGIGDPGIRKGRSSDL